MANKLNIRSIPVEKVQSLLRYDPISGSLHWRESRGRMAAGMVAGCVRGDRGYVQVRIDGAIYYGHRLAWVLKTGKPIPEGAEIDHRDGVTSNNRSGNLRLATSQQNKRNMQTPSHNTSGVKGVTYRKNKARWQAQISVNNQCRYLRSFKNFEDAVAARQKAEREVFGSFSSSNRK